jgi:hypothetical protein
MSIFGLVWNLKTMPPHRRDARQEQPQPQA